MSRQQFGHALELNQEPLGDDRAGLFNVEIDGDCDILLGPRMQRIGHPASLARRRAMASCPGTATTAPDSSSASLRSASRAQASSISGFESRLAINRSSSRERSAGATSDFDDQRAIAARSGV
jgi:hypothetical protein